MSLLWYCWRGKKNSQLYTMPPARISVCLCHRLWTSIVTLVPNGPQVLMLHGWLLHQPLRMQGMNAPPAGRARCARRHQTSEPDAEERACSGCRESNVCKAGALKHFLHITLSCLLHSCFYEICELY